MIPPPTTAVEQDLLDERARLSARIEAINAQLEKLRLREPPRIASLPPQPPHLGDVPFDWNQAAIVGETKRVPVTVAFAYDKLCDEPLWQYLPEPASMGLECWREIGGIDRFSTADCKLRYILQHGRAGERNVRGDFVIYAQAGSMAKLAATNPEAPKS